MYWIVFNLEHIGDVDVNLPDPFRQSLVWGFPSLPFVAYTTHVGLVSCAAQELGYIRPAQYVFA